MVANYFVSQSKPKFPKLFSLWDLFFCCCCCWFVFFFKQTRPCYVISERLESQLHCSSREWKKQGLNIVWIIWKTVTRNFPVKICFWNILDSISVQFLLSHPGNRFVNMEFLFLTIRLNRKILWMPHQKQFLFEEIIAVK